ncbi:BtrH N-terminal domain-containing protein [Paenibacillus chitinolyticus]|uniref:BtrH N-terminal domain-containing protein n=1 Tax=Paenibacillus chitinolyticus TaxID=79263 RepID=UPI001C480318|nr:BtrH N-terminal domain-containing protein [Paenibacillus chitinolyticus]MBV6713644.1 BtrH N-terminal domain-containing protein [Paenibacillus chitinolyticus]
MTFTLYKETRLNCFYVNIAALLKRLPVEDAHLIYLFNQAGLFYRDTEDEDEFQISPYYRLLDDFVYGLFGARLHKTGSSAGDDYMRTLKETLANGKSAIIESDIFYLPYSGFYRRTHFPHALEVTGYREGTFEICDHYYEYHGFLEESELQAVFDASLDSAFYKRLYVWFLKKTEGPAPEELTPAFCKSVIQDNLANMQGAVTYDCPSGSYPGLAAFVPICGKIKSLKTIEEDSVKFKTASYLYEGFREIANSRYHHHHFLKAIGEHALAESYLEADQSWMVAANLLMRAATGNQFQAFEERILARMERVKQKEADNTALLQQWLDRRTAGPSDDVRKDESTTA